jgi:hypothetical protein
LKPDRTRNVLDRLRALAQSAARFVQTQIFYERGRRPAERLFESPDEVAWRKTNAFGQRRKREIAAHVFDHP